MINLESHITNFLSVHYGLKGTELVNKVMGLDLNVTNNDIMQKVFDMVEDGDIIEIEMISPNHVSKSFLVLRGTTINIIRKK